MSSGDTMKAFVARGIRAHHGPALAGAALLASAAFAGPASAYPSGFVSPASAKATIEQRIAARDLLQDQDALRILVRKEADRSTNLVVDRHGKEIRYAVPDLDRAMLHHIAMVQQGRDPADAATDPIYGLDDASWTKMMLAHAAPVGLGNLVEGITTAKDGRAESEDPARVSAMLELKRNPSVATKIFAHWLATQIHKFDDQVGRPPTPGESSVISLTNAWGGEFAAVLTSSKRDARLGPELGILARSWKQALFTDGTHEGWLSTATAMARMEKSAGRTWTDPDAAIPVRDARAADASRPTRAGLDRLAGLVADGQIPERVAPRRETDHDVPGETPPAPAP
jgi:hypothetical protein